MVMQIFLHVILPSFCFTLTVFIIVPSEPKFNLYIYVCVCVCVCVYRILYTIDLLSIFITIFTFHLMSLSWIFNFFHETCFMNFFFSNQTPPKTKVLSCAILAITQQFVNLNFDSKQIMHYFLYENDISEKKCYNIIFLYFLIDKHSLILKEESISKTICFFRNKPNSWLD